MHFKVTPSRHLSAQGTSWGLVSALIIRYGSLSLSVSPLSIKHLHDKLVPFLFPSVELKCYITLNSTYCIEIYWYASNTGHVMRRDDRALGLPVHLPHTAGQVSGMRDEEEDEQGTNATPPQPPSLRGWFTSYGLFLLHSAVIERRLDGADCFRHQTSYSQSVGAVTFSAAPYAQLCGCIHSKKRGGKKLYAFPESTLFFSL